AATVVAFQRNGDNGYLTKIDAVKDGDLYFCNPNQCPLNGLAGASDVKVSPDGRYVYVSGSADDSIVVLWRNTTSGRIANVFGVQYTETIASATDLNDVRGLGLSPDGAYLYAAGYGSDALVVYSRNSSSGKLTLLEKHVQGEPGSPLGALDGLDGPFQVAASPDNASVYVVSTTNASVAAFSRNTIGGKLTWIGTHKDGVNGVTGLSNGSGIAVAPDGKNVYATGYAGKSVVAFKRNVENGLLTYANTVTRAPFTGTGGNPPLDGAREIAVSPDGKNVYAAAYVDSRVVRLDRASPTPLIESITPASVTVGGAEFTIDVYGKDFIPNSRVWIGLGMRTTTYVNSTHLKAVIKNTDISTTGQRVIFVVNPNPGGSSSNQVQLTVNPVNTNPVPVIAKLEPNGAAAGGAAFTLNVYGSSFMATSKVQWNGAERPTTFVNPGQLQAAIGAADIAAGGLAGVIVVNPAPGGGESNAAAFTIAGAGENPRPTITSVSPANAGSVLGEPLENFTMDVYGHNFIEESRIHWNGTARPTEFVSADHLRLVVTAGDTAVSGVADITVVNPEPGGGESNAASFTNVVIAPRSRTYIPLLRK
ncbi:MAG TPA: beta-propeller fold lactonase family protein, partial [Herpetosiphonaceae bacterium]|nr:beta-propeller fold lactonase family protein [Herpetosiphonaceae bacterium]